MISVKRLSTFVAILALISGGSYSEAQIGRPVGSAVTTALLHAASKLNGLAAAATPAGGTFSAVSFPGADASVKINACITAVIAAGGGVCDASGFGGTQKMSQEVHLGVPQVSGVTPVGVTLLLPDNGLWVWQLTDGTSCGIYQYTSTALIGHQPGGGGDRMILEATASKMDSVYCTDTVTSYIRAEGFSVVNNQNSNTFQNGVIHIRTVADQSRFTNIYASNYYGDVWHVESACCGTSFQSIHGVSNGAVGAENGSDGGIPLTVGPGKVRSVSFNDSTFNAPGSGYPDVMITGKSMVMGLNFFNLYMEGNGSIDPNTPMVYIGQYVGPVHFFGGLANTELSAVAATKPVIENHGFYLDVPGMEVVNGSFGINDVTANVKVPVWLFSGNLGTVQSYTTKH